MMYRFNGPRAFCCCRISLDFAWFFPYTHFIYFENAKMVYVMLSATAKFLHIHNHRRYIVSRAFCVVKKSDEKKKNKHLNWAKFKHLSLNFEFAKMRRLSLTLIMIMMKSVRAQTPFWLGISHCAQSWE